MPFRVDPRRDRKLHRLFRDSWPERVRKGRTIYQWAEPAKVVYLVGQGHVRLTLPAGSDEVERTVEVAGPGELFGVEPLLPGARRSTGAAAGEECLLHPLDGREALAALRQSRRSFASWVQASTEDVARLRRTLVRRTSSSTRQRLADLLIELGERWGEGRGRGVVIPHWLTHQQLAELVGSHRSTVTTTLNDWMYEGILKSARRQIHIARPKGLAQLATREHDTPEATS